MRYPNLSAEMGRHGETNRALSEILKISYHSACQKRRGISPWTLDEARKLSKHYGASIEELFYEEEP